MSRVQDGAFDILFGVDEALLGAVATGCKGAVGFHLQLCRSCLSPYVEGFDAGDMEKARLWQGRAAAMVKTLVDVCGGRPG